MHEITMYDNIGKKIKGLAKATFIVEAIVAAILGIALLASGEGLIFTGIIVLLVGPTIAWVSSWLLYGFGELIDKVGEIAQNTRTLRNKPTVTANQGHFNHIENSEKIATRNKPTVTTANQEHFNYIENSEKIATTFENQSSGIMDIPKRKEYNHYPGFPFER